jgi:hypothetical protein
MDALHVAAAVGAGISARHGGELIPPPEEIIPQMRAERDEQLLGLY